MGTIGVIQFPGVNCEVETARSIRGLGYRAEVVRWNRSEGLLDRYAGFILPGGFSYQDRVRAGVIAAREPIVETLSEAAERGMPILGICNGAQILVEAGLVPGKTNRVEAALAPNLNGVRTGYSCQWVWLRADGSNTFLANTLADGAVIPIPMAHAEGRFVSSDPARFDEFSKRGQIPLRYCEADGTIATEWPSLPNGALQAAAAVSNPAGNVVAMMPHPERAAYLHQVPDWVPVWGSRKRSLAAGDPTGLFEAGPGAKILEAFCLAVEGGVQ
ncbi:MAG: phosphoribosylformylglycinamidine synthase I [Gemmatimonadetes bacterium]|nr:phosphoribosylformylglycinamidine synthase I [Gemmatimonadota bacterium]